MRTPALGGGGWVEQCRKNPNEEPSRLKKFSEHETIKKLGKHFFRSFERHRIVPKIEKPGVFFLKIDFPNWKRQNKSKNTPSVETKKTSRENAQCQKTYLGILLVSSIF